MRRRLGWALLGLRPPPATLTRREAIDLSERLYLRATTCSVLGWAVVAGLLFALGRDLLGAILLVIGVTGALAMRRQIKIQAAKSRANASSDPLTSSD